MTLKERLFTCYVSLGSREIGNGIEGSIQRNIKSAITCIKKKLEGKLCLIGVELEATLASLIDFFFLSQLCLLVEDY